VSINASCRRAVSRCVTSGTPPMACQRYRWATPHTSHASWLWPQLQAMHSNLGPTKPEKWRAIRLGGGVMHEPGGMHVCTRCACTGACMSSRMCNPCPSTPHIHSTHTHTYNPLKRRHRLVAITEETYGTQPVTNTHCERGHQAKLGSIKIKCRPSWAITLVGGGLC
jgi:hypothetical protein